MLHSDSVGQKVEDLQARSIPVCETKMGPKELEYVTEALKSGWISGTGGKYLDEFESQFSRYCGAKFGIATSSGTTALHLALAALGIKTGDEIIIPSFTMIACFNSVAYTRAKVVPVDSEPETWNIDPNRIKEKITKRTKVIMPVHIYGHPADMDPILELAEEHDICVVEDAAEAHGAEYKGRKTGALGDVGCFSFYANKIITTGEGGMVITNNEEIAEKARKIRGHAFEKGKRFWHVDVGFNYRMTNVQAAIGVAQMERIDELVDIRRKNACRYNSLLQDVKGVTLPPEKRWARNVYWMYSILVEESFGMSRNELMKRLNEKGVGTRNFFYPIHLQPVYERIYGRKSHAKQEYPVSEGLSQKGLNLPSGSTLTSEQIEYVVESIISSKKGGN